MSVRISQGMVLAAGRGERMRPLTDVMPKPLIEVAGRCMLDRAIDRLEEAGITQVVVNTSYKADMIEAHLRQRKTPSILFSREEKALETGGGIAFALHHFTSPFVVANGDIIWLDGKTPALQRLSGAWKPDMLALLLLHPAQDAVGYTGDGDFFYSDATGLRRKTAGEKAPFVFSGVQLLHPALFTDVPQGAFSMNLLYDRLMEQSPQRIGAVIHDGRWLHVGDVDGKAKAEAVLTLHPS